ncbi:MAG: SAM-dependent methyltransferase [Eubacteriales bacterium]|nr:SAM-dependent methyltransferase [Eubacteriales bacterium]
MDTLRGSLNKILSAGARRFILSKPVSKSELYIKCTLEQRTGFWQLTRYTQKQAFHENIPSEDLLQALENTIQDHYLQVNAFSLEREHCILLSKKGTCTYRETVMPAESRAAAVREEHNRKKQYILEEGKPIAPLVDMGVFTREGKVVRSMYDKFRQINRFLEILEDELANWKGDSIHVIDFGCGKSYLTFIVYYYLTEIRGIRAEIIGLDLKADVIEKCSRAAQNYGYDGLHFEKGDINGYKTPFDVDLVMTLHACDTATDYALYNAVQWKAKLIFSVPCCQHELNGQMEPGTLPILSRYGILKERFCALATDAIRGNLLEYCGYRTQLMEFIDVAHTPKNILIRAVRRPVSNAKKQQEALEQVRALTNEFQFHPTLCRLLLSEAEEQKLICKQPHKMP